jgi:hypothetical protein
MNIDTEILVKGSLCLVAIIVILWRHLRPGRLKPEQAGQALCLTAAVSAMAYFNFGGFHGAGAIHHWEQFHYFLGSKYFPELRYDGLYAASLAAEEHAGLGHGLQSHVRDLRTNEVVPIGHVESHLMVVKDRFTARRWRAFCADNTYFLRSNAYDYITKIRRDHGYNPTPTWTFAARLFSRWLPATSRSLTALAWIDPILLTVMLTFIFRSFGSRIGCLSLIIFGLGYPWRFDWVGGAFLRQDWLVAVGVAVCLLHRRRYGWAGALIAYATMVRVFPGAFLLAPAVVACKELVARQRPTWALRLAGGFALGVLTCGLAGCLTGAGPSAWPEFLANLEKHHGTWLTNNVGLKNVLLYDVATMRRDDVDWNLPEPWIVWQGKMNRLDAERKPWLIAASASFLAVLAAAGWRRGLADTAMLGVAATFAVVVLTCYYWVMLLFIPLGKGRWGPTVGWMTINLALFGLHRLTPPSFEMIYGLASWALAAFFLVWFGPDAWRSLRDVRAHVRSDAR